jgi:hypothetical protein
MGDLFAPVLSLKQKLPELAAMGASAAAATRVDLAAQAEKPAPRPKGRARSASRKNAPAAKKRRV